MVEMQVDGLTLDPDTKAPLVILRSAEEGTFLPLLVGPMEAMSLTFMLSGEQLPRPLTHDLLLMSVQALKGAVVGVEIVDIRDGVYYAALLLRHREGITRVDCRPSDAIAGALRAGGRSGVQGRGLELAQQERGLRQLRADAASDMLREADARREADRLTDRLARGKPLDETTADAEAAGYENLLRSLEPETNRKM